MKKITALLLSLLMFVSVLSACGKKDEPVVPTPTDVTGEEENTDYYKEASQEEEKPDGAPLYYGFEIVDNEADATEYAVISAYGSGKKVLWEYTTREAFVTELDTVEEIGATPYGYLCNVGGTITCIDFDGKLKWENEEFGGASISYSFDNNYNLNIAGYYGPDLFIVDKDGQTIAEYGPFSDDFYWPTGLVYEDGRVRITYDSNGAIISIDTATGDYDIIQSGYIPVETDGDTVIVSTVDDMMEYIGNGANIKLRPGTYNVTEYLRKHRDDMIDFYYYDAVEGDYSGACYNDTTDGLEFVIYNVENMTISSLEPENPATIVAEPRYADVIVTESCSYIEFNDLIMGHTMEGFCTGDVFRADNVYSVHLNNCDLYGCGAYAFEIYGAYDFEAENCVIHDCAYGCAVIVSSQFTYFTDTVFRDCREYTMFEVSDSYIGFTNCDFHDLGGQLIEIYGDTNEVSFSNCSFDEASWTSLNETWEGNADSIFIYNAE